jgi:hypothetical protein
LGVLGPRKRVRTLLPLLGQADEALEDLLRGLSHQDQPAVQKADGFVLQDLEAVHLGVAAGPR